MIITETGQLRKVVMTQNDCMLLRIIFPRSIMHSIRSSRRGTGLFFTTDVARPKMAATRCTVTFGVGAWLARSIILSLSHSLYIRSTPQSKSLLMSTRSFIICDGHTSWGLSRSGWPLFINPISLSPPLSPFYILSSNFNHLWVIPQTFYCATVSGTVAQLYLYIQQEIIKKIIQTALPTS
jgi:hypothetical protein